MIFLEFLLFVEISKAEDFDGPIGYKDGDFDFPGILKTFLSKNCIILIF